MAYEDKRIKMQEQELEYRRNFKWHSIPYSDITNAYLRIEEVKGRLCCSVANFDMYFLVLKRSTGELIKIEASSQEKVKQMLEELKKRNPQTEIGYKKPGEKEQEEEN